MEKKRKMSSLKPEFCQLFSYGGMNLVNNVNQRQSF